MFEFSAAHSVQRLQALLGLCIEVKPETLVLDEVSLVPKWIKELKQFLYKTLCFVATGGQGWVKAEKALQEDPLWAWKM